MGRLSADSRVMGYLRKRIGFLVFVRRATVC